MYIYYQCVFTTVFASPVCLTAEKHLASLSFVFV